MHPPPFRAAHPHYAVNKMSNQNIIRSELAIYAVMKRDVDLLDSLDHDITEVSCAFARDNDIGAFAFLFGYYKSKGYHLGGRLPISVWQLISKENAEYIVSQYGFHPPEDVALLPLLNPSVAAHLRTLGYLEWS